MTNFIALALVAAAVFGFALPSQAYLVATSGVEIVANPVGAGLWDLTLETDTTLLDGSFDINDPLATMAYLNPPCTGTTLICNFFPGTLTGAAGGIFALHISDPLPIGPAILLGQLSSLSLAVPGDFGTAIAASFFGFGGFNAADPLPLTFVVVPEPTTMVLLGAGLAGLAFLRRADTVREALRSRRRPGR